MVFDVARARRETPGCEQVLHFNNAGAGLMPHGVINATVRYLQREALMGAYEAADQQHEAIERIYDTIGRLINAHRDEIALVENATRAWDMAFYGVPFRPGDRILTSAAEYGSNYLAFLQRAKQLNVQIEAIPNDESGQIDLDALKAALDGRVRLIALTHVPSGGGLVNPAAAVGQIAKAAGVLYLLDACQSVGQMPIDVEAIGCDMLAATGRKYLRGPRGTGFLYVRQTVLDQLEPPMIDNHAALLTDLTSFTWRPDARRFETWESSVASRIGLGVAAAYAMSWGLESIEGRIQHLASALRQRLGELPGVTVQDLGRQQCGIVTFTVAGHDPDAVKGELRQQGINLAVTRFASTPLDLVNRQLKAMLRASVHYYNTDEEIERFVDALGETIKQGSASAG